MPNSTIILLFQVLENKFSLFVTTSATKLMLSVCECAQFGSWICEKILVFEAKDEEVEENDDQEIANQQNINNRSHGS